MRAKIKNEKLKINIPVKRKTFVYCEIQLDTYGFRIEETNIGRYRFRHLVSYYKVANYTKSKFQICRGDL